jgi:hypothetical protein
MDQSIQQQINLLLAVGLLSACSEMNPHPMDMRLAVQNAVSKADHEALAKHYEKAVEENLSIANLHRQM